MNDDRFKNMFEDTEFARDKNSDAYKTLRPTEGAERRGTGDDSEDEDEGSDMSDDDPRPAKKPNMLNSLFNGDEAKSDEEKEDADPMSSK